MELHGVPSDRIDPAALQALVEFIGDAAWREHLAGVRERAGRGARSGRAILQRHAIELALDRLRKPGLNREPTTAELRIAAIGAEAARLSGGLGRVGRQKLRHAFQAALAEGGSLVPVFHLVRTALLQASRGFDVGYAGLEDAAPFDLLIQRDGVAAELSCDVISAEEGRDLHRGAWFRLVDRIDPELQTWLMAHPGRYLLKMTLPNGLKDASAATDSLADLHTRITAMLQDRRRGHHDEAVVLRLDPLLLAAAQADELGLVSTLRQQFGPEAHLAVTAAGGGIFVMAARAGRENEVAVAVRRRLGALAPTRLTGTRPGILAMFIEDTDRLEWRSLRETLELEGETRQFLTNPEARRVVAVTCTSRMELFGVAEPDGVSDGELRFRNPAHPAAKTPALAPAVLSSM
jgi:hypothetical protein